MDEEAKGYKILTGILAECGTDSDQTVSPLQMIGLVASEPPVFMLVGLQVSLADFVTAVDGNDWPPADKLQILSLLKAKAASLRKAHLDAVTAQQETRDRTLLTGTELARAATALFDAFDSDKNGQLDSQEVSTLIASAMDDTDDPEARNFTIVKGIQSEFEATGDQMVPCARVSMY